MWYTICWPNLRFLKTRFSEHYRQTKKPRKIDDFLYRHFKQTNHSTSSISIQPVEKIIYGDNSTKRYRNILRHELELKWIKLLQTPHPLGFNDNIYHEGNISRLPDFDVCSLLDIGKRNTGSHGKCKNRNLKRKNKNVLTLSELSIILKHSDRHMGYNLDIIRQSACLVLNPITVYSYGFLFDCMTVGQASGSMTALT